MTKLAEEKLKGKYGTTYCTVVGGALGPNIRYWTNGCFGSQFKNTAFPNLIYMDMPYLFCCCTKLLYLSLWNAVQNYGYNIFEMHKMFFDQITLCFYQCKTPEL